MNGLPRGYLDRFFCYTYEEKGGYSTEQPEGADVKKVLFNVKKPIGKCQFSASNRNLADRAGVDTVGIKSALNVTNCY